MVSSQMSPFVSADTSAAGALHQWSLYGEGHVIAGAIVPDHRTIEAHVLLDGLPIYRSRHVSLASAEEELVALRGHWAREGWIEAS